MKSQLDRRLFIGTAGTSLLVLPGRSGQAAASERVRIAVIGLRNRGTDLARFFASNPGSQVAAVCDVDDAMFVKPVDAVRKIANTAPPIEKDFRRLLDDKTIDAVAIATPDHWHAMLTVLACQAGKDVYVEKPASHNVVEGRRMVEAARNTTASSSSAPSAEARRMFRKRSSTSAPERSARSRMARAWTHQKRTDIGHGQPGPVPAGIDYAMWQGPAPDRPYYGNRLPLQLALVLELGDRRARE